VKLDALDKIFSLCVRERANWTCECCGENHRNNAGYLDCSHIYGRRHRSTRWDPLNAHALCKSCHTYFTDRPTEFTSWVKTTMSDERYEELRQKHHQIFKSTKADRKEAVKWFKRQHAEMCEKREQGQTGYIDFAGYW